MDKPIYRMSSAGKCPRALSAIRLGYKPEPAPGWLERAAEEGKWHEERIREELRTEGYLVGNDQEEVMLTFPTFTLVGHIDGMVRDNKEPFTKMLLEVKSMSQFEFDRWMKGNFKEFPGYADQLACYMEATGLIEALYIVKNRSSGYEDRRVITEQPSDINTVIGKLVAIEECLDHISEPPPNSIDAVYPAEFNPNSLECKRCNFKYLCAPEPKELTAVEGAELSQATGIWRDGKYMVEQGQRFMDNAKAVFERHTKATGINKWRFGELAIALIHVKEALSYPKKKLLQIFSEEELEPASEIKLPYEYIKVEDLRKEES